MMVWIVLAGYVTFIPWVNDHSLPILLNPVTKLINISFVPSISLASFDEELGFTIIIELCAQ